MARTLAPLLALLLVLSAGTAGVAAAPNALDVQRSSEIFTESVLEDKGILRWTAGEDVVGYGADNNPGWYVWYEEGHATDVQAWADGSNSRTVRAHDPDGDVMLISAPADHVGLEFYLSAGSQKLRDLSYVRAIGVNRRVSVDPITPRNLRTESAWERPKGSWLATAGGIRGDLSEADGAAWSDEVNTSTLDEARTAVGADQVAVDGTGVRVAIIDTGLDYKRSLYGSRVVAGKNTITNTTLNITDPTNATAADYEAVADGAESNHGSWVATAIAGNGSSTNATGVAPGAELVPIKALADDGSGTTEDIAEGLEYACGESNADVVSMSLGSAVPSARIESEIQECLGEDGVSAVVVAAGNNRMTYRYTASPADTDQAVVTVAATDVRAANESESAYFSAVGPDPETGVGPDVSAPGMQITAEVADGNVTLSGTSMATPLVSGVLALTLEAHPRLEGQPDELLMYLEGRAEPLENAGETEVGAGRVSATNTVNDVVPEERQADVLSDESEARDTGNEALAGSYWRELGVW